MINSGLYHIGIVMKKRLVLSVLALILTLQSVPVTTYANCDDNVEKQMEELDNVKELGEDNGSNKEEEDAYSMNDEPINNDNSQLYDVAEWNFVSPENATMKQIENEDQIFNSFNKEDGGIRYYGEDGNFVKGQVIINGYCYSFDDGGYLKLGLQNNELTGSTYYYTEVEPYIAINMFITLEDGTRYFDTDGRMLTQNQKIGSNWYYFDDKGIMYNKGWREEDESKYYYYADGTLALGFADIEGNKYYFNKSGKMVTGCCKINNNWYYFDDQGIMYNKGWREEGESKYYYYADGTLALGFADIEGNKYYFDKSGKMVIGRYKVNSNWYYFDDTGIMYDQGWREENGNRYYYNKDGTLALKEKKISDYWYFFGNNGVMYIGWRNANRNKYYYDEYGHLQLGIAKIGSYWYYFKNNGAMHIGWRSANGSKYYYDTQGHLKLGVAKIGSYWYYFKNNGVMYIGWRNANGNKYYYDGQGRLKIGATKIGSYWYYFKNNGAMYTGWRTSGSNKYYYNSQGQLQLGPSKIGGSIYYFDSDGSLAENQAMCKKAQQYSSSTKWLILVDTKKNRVGIFSGSKGEWIGSKYWKCTTGASSSPTVKGQFKVGIKGKVFGSGYSCWYYTQFYGNYLFHSILYKQGSMTSIKDGRLGINASHGCVRLSLTNAKWIYDNIPKNTKVVVY